MQNSPIGKYIDEKINSEKKKNKQMCGKLWKIKILHTLAERLIINSSNKKKIYRKIREDEKLGDNEFSNRW